MSDNFKGIEYLRQKLTFRQARVRVRYQYYEMKKSIGDPGSTIPAELRERYRSTLGWCAKAVDSLADRLVFREFRNDKFDLTGIYNMNNPDTLFDSAILSALISSCCFIYISPDNDGFPRMQVIDGGNATGVIDEITGLLTEGYAVLERDNDTGAPVLEAYFAPDRTDYIRKEERCIESIPHNAGRPLLVPVIYRPDAVRPFGHSRISRACMYYQQYACRVLERSDISGEFYSYPQRYALGVSDELELEPWRAAVSAMLMISKDEDGDRPTLGQFSQQSMSPYTEQLKTAASGFAGETGLTLDDLGFATENPSSAEAIKASHENLRLAARKAQRSFGSGFLNAGYLAACLRDGFPYKRRELYKTLPCWYPIFEPDAAMLSGIGDGVIKINQAVPGYISEKNMIDLTGLSPEGETSAITQTIENTLSEEDQNELFGE